MANDSVAIIIAAYNAQETIGRAIASALAEPQVREVFVVDDASRDGTVAEAYKADNGSGRLKILALDTNGGPSVARNKALEQATAEWVGVLDADDFFLPGRIATLLKQTGNADLIADDMWQVAENAIDGLRKSLLPIALNEPMTVDFTGFIDAAIPRRGKERGELSFIKPLMRRALMESNNVRYQEQMRLGEDFEIYARLLGLGGRLVIVPERGYVSVVRPTSLSAAHSTHDLTQLRDCHDTLLKDLTLTPAQRNILKRHRDSVDARLQWRRMIEAVKARNIGAALSCFNASWHARFYVLQKLFDQIYLRLRYGSDKARAMQR